MKNYQDVLDAVEIAWGIIASTSEGDWKKQRPEWQEAAKRWYDENGETIAQHQRNRVNHKEASDGE